VTRSFVGEAAIGKLVIVEIAFYRFVTESFGLHQENDPTTYNIHLKTHFLILGIYA